MKHLSFSTKLLCARYGIPFLSILLFLVSPSYITAGFQDGIFASHKGDYATAIREFRSLAESGHAESQVQLGIMYEMGLGVKQDLNEAAKWYQKAAIQGDKNAHGRLFEMRRKGLNLTYQPPIPESWQGNTTEPQSQYDIGVMYFKGIGVQMDLALAYRWFYLAANQGHIKAQNDLAVLLSKGLGIQRNKQEAYIWFVKAAEQGFADSQYNLGVMLSQSSGEGIPQHLLLAYMWFEIAAQNGILEARNNQVRLAKKMNETQIDEAKSQARRWLTKNRRKEVN